MIAAIANAQRLDWNGWFKGCMGAIISGGAGAVGAGFGASLLDPGHDFVGLRLLELMASAFAFSGIISLAKFLQTHPTPDAVPVATVETTTVVHPADPSVPETKTQSTTEVLGPAPNDKPKI